MIIDKYITKNGKKLRYGYTTGSCGAAASKGSALMLLKGKSVDKVVISTPKGWDLELRLLHQKLGDNWACCGVKKDAGDDPDITNGIIIYSKVSWRKDNKICIEGGKGVGKITKKGLPLEVGKPAINPVPLKMIEKEVREVIGKDKGVNIEIFVPKGEEIALKTFNPKLGIKGGISILGTSGIVEPMSEEAWKESLALEISVAVKEGLEKLIFVPGNYGRDIIKQHYNLHEKYIVKVSNFIGFMLDKALEYKVKKILLVGHLGKLVKVAAGIFHTHSKIADGRRETIAAYLGLLGASCNEIEALLNSNTTEEAVSLIKAMQKEEVFLLLAKKITEKAKERTFGNIEIGTVIFTMEEGILAICPEGQKLLEEFKDEENLGNRNRPWS